MAKKQEQNEQRVVNTTAQRMELVFDKTYVFLPGKTVRVPSQYSIPKNIGLLVK